MDDRRGGTTVGLNRCVYMVTILKGYSVNIVFICPLALPFTHLFSLSHSLPCSLSYQLTRLFNSLAHSFT